MMIVIGIVLLLIVSLLIWFYIPYSPVKSSFLADIKRIAAANCCNFTDEVFTSEDFSELPEPIRKYILNCNYIGKPKMSFMRIAFDEVDFKQGKEGPSLKIGYTQYNFAKEPSRMALIDSMMFGVPFEGYDSFDGGKGGMKGVVGKVITIFDQRGVEMDTACLVTYLSKSIFIPTALISGFITFEQLSDFTVMATIKYKGLTARGVFTFNSNYEMISFQTDDRGLIGNDGKIEYVPWTAECGDYEVNQQGINFPTSFKAVWNYTDGDFTYFDGDIKSVKYDTDSNNAVYIS